MTRTTVAAALAGALAMTAGVAAAQDNMGRLQDFRQTGSQLVYVDQAGAKAAQLRENLKRIRMPEGFAIDLFAVVPDARHMAIGRNVGVVFVGTRKDKMWAVTDRDKDRVADEVKQFAPSMSMKFPNGPCFTRDGFLIVAEHNRVLSFPAAEFFYEGGDVAVAVVKDQLFAKDKEYFNHAFRVCTIGPHGKVYVAIGQPYNVFPKAQMPMKLYGSIVRMNLDGSGFETVAEGVRNSVGITFRPGTNELWWTDNQVDGMGDDIPPGEIDVTRLPEDMGKNYGHPWYGGGKVRTVDYKDETPPAGIVHPVVETVAHAADLGLTFYTGRMFPEKYRGALFNAQHGSWNRTTPIGARIMVTYVDKDGKVTGHEPFAEGWLDDDTGEYLGRPVDVAVYLDGSLLVSDDLAGAIYRISYQP
jgi:glucose/arabinose dehydrogenase